MSSCSVSNSTVFYTICGLYTSFSAVMCCFVRVCKKEKVGDKYKKERMAYTEYMVRIMLREFVFRFRTEIC